MANRPVTRSQPSKGQSPVNNFEKSSAKHQLAKSKRNDYGSEGVRDHDVFALPATDYQLIGVLTVIAAVVRLFRIYQPSSVVFDEVQYVPVSSSLQTPLEADQLIALAASRPSTSKGVSLWTYIRRWPSSS